MTGRWWLRAACRDSPPDVRDEFFPPPGQRGLEHLDGLGVRAICRACPVVVDCLAAAVDEEAGKGRLERDGIRGGLSARTRHRIEETAEHEGWTITRDALQAAAWAALRDPRRAGTPQVSIDAARRSVTRAGDDR